MITAAAAIIIINRKILYEDDDDADVRPTQWSGRNGVGFVPVVCTRTRRVIHGSRTRNPFPEGTYGRGLDAPGCGYYDYCQKISYTFKKKNINK